MVVQFFKGGRTFAGAKSAIAYLLNDRVEKEQAKVFAGNSDLTLRIIKSINRKWKFTSGVISFEEQYEEVKNILPEIKEKFEKAFFCGLNKDQYNILYVLHTDKNRAELHFIVPRTELKTGKDLAIYTHKKDLTKKDLFQQHINIKYGLTNPLDKSKKRTLEVSTKWSNDNKELKKQIHKYIEKAVTKGFISNREEIIQLLENAGFRIKRKGKDYISIQNDDMKRAIRLKGVYYNENFRSIRELRTEYRTARKADSSDLRAKSERVKQKLDERIKNDSEANRERYKARKQDGIREHRLGAGEVKNTNKMDMVNRGDNVRDNNTSSSDNDIQIKRESDDSTRTTTIRRIRAKREARARAIREAKRKRRELYKKIKRDREELLRENREERRKIYQKLTENSSRQQAELGSAAAAAAELKRKAERNRAAAAAITEYRQEREQRFINAIKRFSGAVREFAERTREYIAKVRRGIDLFVLISQPKQPKPKQEQKRRGVGLRL